MSDNLTSCKDCVFAIWDEDTQTGCKQDALSKMNNVEAYDEEKKFNVVLDVCLLKRKSKWAEGKEDLVKSARDEIKIDYQILTNDVDVDKLISLCKSDHPPSRIVIFADIGLDVDDDVIDKKLYQDLNMDYTLIQDLEARSFEDRIDSYLINKLHKKPYYLKLNDNDHVSFADIEKINNDLTIEMNRVGLVKTANYILVHQGFHDFLSGNFDKSIEEKIEDKWIKSI